MSCCCELTDNSHTGQYKSFDSSIFSMHSGSGSGRVTFSDAFGLSLLPRIILIGALLLDFKFEEDRSKMKISLKYFHFNCLVNDGILNKECICKVLTSLWVSRLRDKMRCSGGGELL